MVAAFCHLQPFHATFTKLQTHFCLYQRNIKIPRSIRCQIEKWKRENAKKKLTFWKQKSKGCSTFLQHNLRVVCRVVPETRKQLTNPGFLRKSANIKQQKKSGALHTPQTISHKCLDQVTPIFFICLKDQKDTR